MKATVGCRVPAQAALVQQAWPDRQQRQLAARWPRWGRPGAGARERRGPLPRGLLGLLAGLPSATDVGWQSWVAWPAGSHCRHGAGAWRHRRAAGARRTARGAGDVPGDGRARAADRAPVRLLAAAPGPRTTTWQHLQAEPRAATAATR